MHDKLLLEMKCDALFSFNYYLISENIIKIIRMLFRNYKENICEDQSRDIFIFY